MNSFNFLSAESAEDRLAQLSSEEIYLEKECEAGCQESIFQSEFLTVGMGFAASDFGW